MAALAVPSSASYADAKSTADGIVAFMMKTSGAEDVQSLIDGALADGAGTTAEWYVIALAQSGESYDFLSYVDALGEYISAERTLGATTAQKYALAMLACGAYADLTVETLDGTIGELGIMSYIYGLHLLNNGLTTDKISKDDVIGELLSLELDGGGWAITGSVADVDVTAMALAALAPNIDALGADGAIERALAFLSEKQFPDGGYSSMMSGENPESTAQVMLALSSLGVDFESDERFIKNGSTLLDAMMSFSVGDGGFSHTKGGEYNFSATVQVYYSLVGYLRMKDGKSPLLVFDNAPGAVYIENFGSPAEVEPENTGGIGYKPIATAALVGAFVIVCAVFILLKKKNAKNFIAAAVILAAAITFVWVTDIMSPDDYYGAPTKKENAVGTVTMTIRCDTIVGKSDEKYIPADGVILETTSFEIEEGDTVYDILAEGARAYGISIDVSSVGYVSGIGYIYELDYGSLSGWMYYVNGESPGVSCTRYTLDDGDVIEWLYSCDIGNDLK